VRAIKQLVLHQTGSSNDTVESITRWHTTPPGSDLRNPKGMGWKTCGYHFIITPDAVVHKTLAQGIIGNHCAGDNAHSLGVCCVGKGAAFPLDVGYMSSEMFAALLRLLQALLRAYPEVGPRIYGHREKASGIQQHKSCPGFDCSALRHLLT